MTTIANLHPQGVTSEAMSPDAMDDFFAVGIALSVACQQDNDKPKKPSLVRRGLSPSRYIPR